jgi:hypothetical protein
MAAANWSAHKVVCFESDDWGCCAWAPDEYALQRVSALREVRAYWQSRRLWPWIDGSLETPDDVRCLCDFLERFTGGDGRPAVFTPCYIVGNPDFERIAADNLGAYYDITIDQGVPSRWERGDFVGAAREGYERRVWRPEYHARLHHTQPHLWLQAVRDGNPEAGALFEEQMFQCSERVGEYEEMDEATQREWVGGGIEAFERAFGCRPYCGINGDATEVTEGIWQEMGIKARLNRWQHRMGQRSPHGDAVYLRRNARLEPLGLDDEYAQSGFTRCWWEVRRAWEACEPAVISTHRKNYVSFVAEQQRQGYMQLEQLLVAIAESAPDTAYLTSTEIAQLYKTGTSALAWPGEVVCRNYTGEEQLISLPLESGQHPIEARDLRTDAEVEVVEQARRLQLRVPDGDFAVAVLS